MSEYKWVGAWHLVSQQEANKCVNMLKTTYNHTFAIN